MNHYKTVFGLIVACAILAWCSTPGLAQGTGGGGSGAGTGGGSTTGGLNLNQLFGSTGSTNSGMTNSTSTFGSQSSSSSNFGSSGSNNNTSSSNGGLDLSQNPLTFDFENKRIQPFVGPSSENVTHPRSLMASTATNGSGSTTRSTGTTRQTNPLASLLRGNQFGGQNFGLGAIGNSASSGLPRRGVRTAMQYTFSPNLAAVSVAAPANFESRIQRTPQFQGVGPFHVTMNNRTATLSGTVANSEQKSLLERQLLLEPGVSDVVNNLQIIPQ